MKQWNIGVYFSLRFQEIAGGLDSALTAVTINPVQNSHRNQRDHKETTLKQSITLLESLRSCWRRMFLFFPALINSSDYLCSFFQGTQLGCLLAWQLAKRVVQDQTQGLALNGPFLHLQKILLM